MGEIIFHGFLMMILGFFYHQTNLINTARMTDPIGPAGFPRIMIILAFALLTSSLIKAVKKYRTTEKKKGSIEEFDKGFLILFASIIAFVLLVNYLGFLIASGLLILAILLILGQRKLSRVVLFTVVASLVFTLVFGNLLSVPLPRGIGALKSLSHLLY